MLRIDELDGLGCCCFCSIQFVASDAFYNKNPGMISAFMGAMRRCRFSPYERP
jgi:pyrimidine precursor biosynthesis enzyme